MASTLLAVDDSATMRKVLEITFAGSDFNVVAVPTADAALAKLKDKPDVVICDITLEPKNGYDVCKAIKQASPGTPVLLLSSKQNPYDAARGQAAQADDHMDKPFDTQQMIDKVRKVLQSKGEGAAAAPPAAAAQPAAAAAAPAAAAPTRPNMPAVQQPAPAPAAGSQVPQRAKTLIYTPPVQGQPPVAAAAQKAPAVVQKAEPIAATPVTGVPLQSKQQAPTAPAPAATASAAVAAHVNGQMAGRLEGMGLTPAQADAVMALSRELVERVVWEVVPVLAETIIKEEIARLTK